MASMNRAIFCLIVVAATLLPACASSRNSSQAEWARGQCEQINDEEARKKCFERVDAEYGRR
jgi:hypothetical protein